MCYHYKINKKTGDLELHYKTRWTHTVTIVETGYQKGFDYPKVPMLSNDTKELSLGAWGLLPQTVRTPEQIKEFRIKFTGALNARIENLHSSPLWSQFAENRCLLPAESFKEWRHEAIEGRKTPKKVPYEIVCDRDIFSMAGIYSDWTSPEGEVVRTFAIITTAANKAMEYVHNTKHRMPVVIRPEDEQRFLDGAPIEEFAFPYENKLMFFQTD